MTYLHSTLNFQLLLPLFNFHQFKKSHLIQIPANVVAPFEQSDRERGLKSLPIALNMTLLDSRRKARCHKFEVLQDQGILNYIAFFPSVSFKKQFNELTHTIQNKAFGLHLDRKQFLYKMQDNAVRLKCFFPSKLAGKTLALILVQM